MNKQKQVIVEDENNNKISTIKFSSQRILMEIWDPDKGLVYIWIRQSEDILKLKRFFEGVEIKKEEVIN